MNKTIKTMIQRGAIGLLFGIAVSYLISISISSGIGDGGFHPCSPELLAQFSTELQAVIFQVLLSAVYGFIIAGVTVVWEQETWSLLKQTTIHFCVLFISTFGIGWLCHWFPHTTKSILIGLGIFLVTYLICWSLGFLAWKKKVQGLNKK